MTAGGVMLATGGRTLFLGVRVSGRPLDSLQTQDRHQ